MDAPEPPEPTSEGFALEGSMIASVAGGAAGWADGAFVNPGTDSWGETEGLLAVVAVGVALEQRSSVDDSNVTYVI